MKVINGYIQMLQAGHVKEGLREASKEEVAFATALLQAIAADIEAAARTGDPAAAAVGPDLKTTSQSAEKVTGPPTAAAPGAGNMSPGDDPNIPRRIRIDRLTPAELAIRDAILVVEEAGCDVRLTDAVVLLSQAKDKVADFVDGVIRLPGCTCPGSCPLHNYPEPPAPGQLRGKSPIDAALEAAGWQFY